MLSSLTNKILIFVFVLLFAVLVGELGYFIYTSKSNGTGNPLALINNLSNSNVSPTPASNQGSSTLAGVYQTSLANYLKLGSLGLLKFAALTNNYSGKILKIENKNYLNISKLQLPQGYLPVLRIQLQSTLSKKPESFYIYFNQSEYYNAVVKIGSVKKTMSDLKIGQTVDVTETMSLLDNNLNTDYLISVSP